MTAPDEAQLVCSYPQALDDNSIQNWVQVQIHSTPPQCWVLFQRHFVARLATEGQPPSFVDVFIAVLADQLRRFSMSGAHPFEDDSRGPHLQPLEVPSHAAHRDCRTLCDALGRWWQSEWSGRAADNEDARIARLLRFTL